MIQFNKSQSRLYEFKKWSSVREACSYFYSDIELWFKPLKDNFYSAWALKFLNTHSVSVLYTNIRGKTRGDRIWLVTRGKELTYPTWEDNTYISEMFNRNKVEKITNMAGWEILQGSFNWIHNVVTVGTNAQGTLPATVCSTGFF